MKKLIPILFASSILASGAYATEKTLIINEVFPNPQGKDTDGEFIEISNLSGKAVDLSGYQLRDSNLKSKNKSYTIPSAKLSANGVIALAYAETRIGLNNDGDTIELLDPSGVVISSVTYGKAKEGESYGYDGKGYVWGEPTPGAANRFARPDIVESKSEGQAASITSVRKEDAPMPKQQDREWYGYLLIGLAGATAIASVILPGNKQFMEGVKRIGSSFKRESARDLELGD